MTAQQDRYVVCTVKPWNIAAFSRCVPALLGQWHLIETPEQLSVAALERIAPRYVFFPHWSWRVAAEITTGFECICFHMADVPYGRGGSPLQNLIVRGHRSTVLSALRMVQELDAGPIYLKRPLSLEGRAEEIFERAADLIYDLIAAIIAERPTPVAQHGNVVVFPRRTPHDSLMPQAGHLKRSMTLSACSMRRPTQRRSSIGANGGFEFDHVQMTGEGVEAHVAIRKRITP